MLTICGAGVSVVVAVVCKLSAPVSAVYLKSYHLILFVWLSPVLKVV